LQAVGFTGVTNIMDIAFNAAGQLFGTVSGGLYRFNPLTGQLMSAIGIQSNGFNASDIMGLMFDENDRLLATTYTSNSTLLQINATTGATSVIGSTGMFFGHGGDIFVGGISPAPVPLPATAIPCGLGLLGLVGAASLRRSLFA
jgi:hypothetical protein